MCVALGGRQTMILSFKVIASFTEQKSFNNLHVIFYGKLSCFNREMAAAAIQD